MSSSNPLGCSLISKRYCLKVFDNFRASHPEVLSCAWECFSERAANG